MSCELFTIAASRFLYLQHVLVVFLSIILLDNLVYHCVVVLFLQPVLPYSSTVFLDFVYCCSSMMFMTSNVIVHTLPSSCLTFGFAYVLQWFHAIQHWSSCTVTVHYCHVFITIFKFWAIYTQASCLLKCIFPWLLMPWLGGFCFLWFPA